MSGTNNKNLFDITDNSSSFDSNWIGKIKINEKLEEDSTIGEREKLINSFNSIDPEMLARTMKNKQPTIISLLLLFIENPETTGFVINSLSEEIQTEVFFKIATADSIPVELITGVLKEMINIVRISEATSLAKGSGIEFVADVLNTIDKATENRILTTIEQTHPDLVKQIKEFMFSFEDLVLIDPHGIQAVLKETEQNDLVLALKSTSDTVKEHIFSNMSERAADMIRDDLDALGPVRVADVRSIQQKIVKIARTLEEEGRIIIGGSNDNIMD